MVNMYMVESFSKELSFMFSFETESNKKYLLPVAIIKWYSWSIYIYRKSHDQAWEIP